MGKINKRPAPAPKRYFRSGIHGGLNVPKDYETPENMLIVDEPDENYQTKNVWLKVYMDCIFNNKQRHEARMIADEALEDYLEKFNVT